LYEIPNVDLFLPKTFSESIPPRAKSTRAG
jgi:hypothetical protein